MENKSNKNDGLKEDFESNFSVSKENSFKIPENYFDSLPGKIQDQCKDLPGNSLNKRAIAEPALKLTYAAAAVMIMAAIVYHSFDKPNKETFLTADEIAEIVLMQSVGMDEVMLMDELAGEDRGLQQTDFEIQMEDYLIYNNIESSELIAEL